MDFKTRPTDATPQLRRVDRRVEEPVTTAMPQLRRREQAELPHTEPRPSLAAVLRSVWDRLTKTHTLAIGLAVGLIIGLPLLGWWLWPVQWTDASFNELGPAEQALVIETVADYYAYSGDPVRVAAVLHDWQDGESLICAMAAQEDDFWAKARLVSVAAVRNGRGCE